MIAVVVLVMLLGCVFFTGCLLLIMHGNNTDDEVGTLEEDGGGGGGDLLPVTDLRKSGAGAWRALGRIDWKTKNDVVTFQGEPALRVFYGKGSGTSHHSGEGGMGFDVAPRGLPGTSAMISFQVWFDTGWNFSGGGKLTGFKIGTGDASGGRHSTTGSSCRISFKEGGGAWMYVYPAKDLPQEDPAVSRTTGTGIGLFRENFPAGTFKVGQWNNVRLGVRLNTFDSGGNPNADGMAYLSVNDRSATLKRMRWSRSKDLLITAYMFSTFFGGSEPSLVDCNAYYRNFRFSPWTS